MKNSGKLLVFLILLLITQSCNKDSQTDDNTKDYSKSGIDIQRLWDCNKSQNFDEVTLTSKLIGSWKWVAESCFWTGKTINADKDVIITLNQGGSFSVKEDSIEITNGIWKLKDADSGILGLDLDHKSGYLYGRILICDNEVLFNHSYIDGCDNLFLRVK